MISNDTDTPVDNTTAITTEAEAKPEATTDGDDNAKGIIDKIFGSLVKTLHLVIDSETARKLKKQAREAYNLALAVGKNLGDVNKDGKVDAEDLQAVVQKLVDTLEGIDRIDPDLKTALLAGVVACAAIFLIPVVGQSLAIPAFASATAFFFLKAKLTKMKK